MIIEHSALFGCLGIIIFQLTEWIAIVKMSDSTDSVLSNDMLGFSYLAIPARHEVPRVPYLHEHNMNKTPEKNKALEIADAAKQYESIN